MSFYSGQKVVCINDAPTPGKKWMPNEAVVKGQIYTVFKMHGLFNMGTHFDEIVELVEIQRHPIVINQGLLGYNSNRFEPLNEKDTDISIFKKLLKTKEDALQE